MKRQTLALLAILAVAAALALGLAVRGGLFRGAEESAGPVVGGPFHLVDQAGKPVDESVLKGKWNAVFFGFTFCPEACPTTLFTLGQAQKLLGPKGDDLRTVFISVDPERDTPAQLANYLNNDAFPKGTLGLTGSMAQVDQAVKAYHAYYEKDGEGPNYNVNHSTATYLMSPKGRFVCVLPYGLTPEQTAERIGKAMRAGAGASNC